MTLFKKSPERGCLLRPLNQWWLMRMKTALVKHLDVLIDLARHIKNEKQQESD